MFFFVNIAGVESVSIDTNEKKLTLTGDVDPIKVVSKLRKLCQTEVVSIGALNEEKKETTDANVPIPLPSFESYPVYYQMTPQPYIRDYYYV